MYNGGKLNTMVTRTEKGKSTVVINVKIFYKMFHKECLSLHLITEIERVRSMIGKVFHNLGNLQ